MSRSYSCTSLALQSDPAEGIAFSRMYASLGKNAPSATAGESVRMALHRDAISCLNSSLLADGNACVWGSLPGGVIVAACCPGRSAPSGADAVLAVPRPSRARCPCAPFWWPRAPPEPPLRSTAATAASASTATPARTRRLLARTIGDHDAIALGARAKMPASILLAVPNVSEGRDVGVIAGIARSLAEDPAGVRLLDRHSDPD